MIWVITFGLATVNAICMFSLYEKYKEIKGLYSLELKAFKLKIYKEIEIHISQSSNSLNYKFDSLKKSLEKNKIKPKPPKVKDSGFIVPRKEFR